VNKKPVSAAAMAAGTAKWAAAAQAWDPARAVDAAGWAARAAEAARKDWIKEIDKND